MGSSESANHEWIELTNDGAAVNVAGWTITDSQNFDIELTGTIPAGATVVLERSSEASAPGTSFLLYTGALVNSGATLQLENAAGQLMDLVSGGENWQSIGGDNTTKETAQYTPRGWVTKAATAGIFDTSFAEPVVAPAAQEEPAEAHTNTSSHNSNANKNQSDTVPLELPDVTLQLNVSAQSKGYVNQSIAFQVEPSGIGDRLLDSLTYQWNFGDGFTASSKEPNHVFAFPGTYVVTVKAQYKRQTQLTRHEITILPVELSLTKNAAGDVQLNNDSPYEIDISGYVVKGVHDFVFPAYSIILPNQTITLPRKYLATEFEPMVAVYDTKSTFVAGRLPPGMTTLAMATVIAPQAPVISIRPQPALMPVLETPVVLASENMLTQSPAGEAVEPVADQSASAARTLSSLVPLSRSERLPYVAFCIVLLLGILAVYLKPKRTPEAGPG